MGVEGCGAAALLEEHGGRRFTALLQALPSSCCGHKLCLPRDFHTFYQHVFHLALGVSGQRMLRDRDVLLLAHSPLGLLCVILSLHFPCPPFYFFWF